MITAVTETANRFWCTKAEKLVPSSVKESYWPTGHQICLTWLSAHVHLLGVFLTPHSCPDLWGLNSDGDLILPEVWAPKVLIPATGVVSACVCGDVQLQLGSCKRGSTWNNKLLQSIHFSSLQIHQVCVCSPASWLLCANTTEHNLRHSDCKLSKSISKQGLVMCSKSDGHTELSTVTP